MQSRLEVGFAQSQVAQRSYLHKGMIDTEQVKNAVTKNQDKKGYVRVM